jgi:hypothetical protein
MEFTESERSTIENCLMVAAERFKEHAQFMREQNQKGLAEQFDRQVEEAQRLREKISELP